MCKMSTLVNWACREAFLGHSRTFSPILTRWQSFPVHNLSALLLSTTSALGGSAHVSLFNLPTSDDLWTFMISARSKFPAMMATCREGTFVTKYQQNQTLHLPVTHQKLKVFFFFFLNLKSILPERQSGCCNSLFPYWLPGTGEPVHSFPEWHKRAILQDG